MAAGTAGLVFAPSWVIVWQHTLFSEMLVLKVLCLGNTPYLLQSRAQVLESAGHWVKTGDPSSTKTMLNDFFDVVIVSWDVRGPQLDEIARSVQPGTRIIRLDRLTRPEDLISIVGSIANF